MLSLKDPERAQFLQRFFKTGKGEYAAGDKFLGMPVPVTRQVSREFRDLPLDELKKLLVSPWHEIRLLALFIMVLQTKKATDKHRKDLYSSYLAHTNYVNNWDLVDSSTEHIVGSWLFDKDRKPLFRLAKSKSLWERRIAMISCFYFIRKNDFGTALDIAEILLHDKEDLIHKAVGWMLREIGERDILTEKEFLDAHYKTMPRTMLRYAIEKFPERERKMYLKGEI